MGFKGSMQTGYYLTKVTEGGGAAAAGLRVGHRILAVNGLSVDAMQRAEVTAAMKPPAATRCNLTVVIDPTGCVASCYVPPPFLLLWTLEHTPSESHSLPSHARTCRH
jgi:hypothetical protein